MSHLRHNDASFALARGETRVGWSAGSQRPQFGSDAGSECAVVVVSDDGRAMVHPASFDVSIHVNGVPVGREAAPLLHGDRLTINGCELRFADEAMSGDTGEFRAVEATHVAAPSVGVLDARSKGRLVSMVDGREYPVGAAGILIGRDPACDVVVASPGVSRRHARIDADPAGGFVLADLSRHGTLVNDGRVDRSLALGRGDAIQVGGELFRFYAESEAAAPARTLAEVPQLQSTGALPSAKRPVALATLEVLNSGPSRGTTFSLYAPLSHVGRGAYNDVSIADDSVSEFHAKLQRRENGWWVVDMGSTNGTYVNGERVRGEAPLPSGADVRFGGVKMGFRIDGAATQNGGETRVVVGLRAPDPQRAGGSIPASAARPERRAASSAASPAASSDGARRSGLVPWLLIASLGAIFVYLVLQGR